MKCLETESPAYHITAYWQYNVIDDRLGEEFFGIPSICKNITAVSDVSIIEWDSAEYIVEDVTGWPVRVIIHEESFLHRAVRLRDIIATLDKIFNRPIREVTKEAIRLLQDIEGVTVYNL